MFSSFEVSASGMEAQRIRLDVIASNLANIETTRGPNGEPYRRKDVIFAAVPSYQIVPVRVLRIIEDNRPFKVVYNPGHPDADREGYVKLPNINPLEEMANMLAAIRAYEANVTAFNSAKQMMLKALEIGRY